MNIEYANEHEKENGWSFSFETMKAIQSKFPDDWTIELEDIDQILLILDMNNLLNLELE